MAVNFDLDGVDQVAPNKLFTWTIFCTNGSDQLIDITEELTASLVFRDNIIKGKLRHEKVGEYSFDFITDIRGEWNLRIYHGQNQIFKTANIITTVTNNLPSDSISYQFSIEGVALSNSRVGDKKELSIEVVDNLNNHVNIDASNLKIKVVGPKTEVTFLTFNHKSTGIYMCEFMSPKAGHYKAIVVFDGTDVVTHPIILHEQIAPDRCLISEIPTQIIISKKYSVTISARDKHGNPLSVGGDSWEVGLVGKVKTHVVLTDNKDGTYTLEFSVPQAGEYTLRIMYISKFHVTGSPCNIVCI